MPTIPPPVLDTAIYLYPSPAAADAGERAGGSGFLVAVPLEDHPAATFYAVTNAHVIANGCTTVRFNTADGGHDSVEIADAEWIRHPEGDDVAMAEVALAEHFRYSAIPVTSFVDGYDPTLFAVGQEAYMIGRFVNHEGRQRNLPTARFGHIAQLPYERIRTEQGIEQDAFLVEVRSLAGYSGSPVFVYRNRPDLDTNAENWIKSFEHRFLGIDFGHLPSLGPVVTRDHGATEFRAEQNSGMAAVIPAWRVQQLIDEPDVAAAREAGEREWLEQNTPRDPS